MADESSDRYQPPPDGRDPECALLALLLHDNDLFREIPFMHCEQLKNAGYREIYLAMQAQHAEQRPFNAATLRAGLEHQPIMQGRIDEWLDTVQFSLQVHRQEAERKKAAAKDADNEFSETAYFAELAKTYVMGIKTRHYREQLYAGAKAFVDGLDGTRSLEDAALHLEQLAMGTLGALREGKGSEPLGKILQDVFQQIQNVHDRKGRLLGLPTGFYELDDLTAGLQPGNLYVIAGRPSMGKTSLLCNILENIALMEQKRALMFSLEMSKPQIATLALCSHARVDSQLLRTGRVSEEEFQKLLLSAGALNEGWHVFDDDPVSIEMLVDEARRVKRRENIGIIGIDYLQRIRAPGMQKYNNRPMEVAHVSNSLKALAKSLNVPVIVNAQLNRSAESREDRRPMLSDLRESGAIEQDADVVMLLYREEHYVQDSEKKGIAEITLAKNRSGPTGTVELAFLKHYARFENLAARPSR